VESWVSTDRFPALGITSKAANVYALVNIGYSGEGEQQSERSDAGMVIAE
jgi:hypothetical protein